MAKWIEFVQQPPHPEHKTTRWAVITKEAASIGLIYWYTRWRKYVFAPDANTVYEQECLRDIAAFIEQKTREHYESKRLARAH